MKKCALLSLLLLALVVASGCTVTGSGGNNSGTRNTFSDYGYGGGHGGHSH